LIVAADIGAFAFIGVCPTPENIEEEIVTLLDSDEPYELGVVLADGMMGRTSFPYVTE
jgi:hypothetical protein